MPIGRMQRSVFRAAKLGTPKEHERVLNRKIILRYIFLMLVSLLCNQRCACPIIGVLHTSKVV